MAKHADDPGTLDLFPDELAAAFIIEDDDEPKTGPTARQARFFGRPARPGALQIHGLGEPGGSGKDGTGIERPAGRWTAGFSGTLAVTAVPGG